MYGNSSTLVTAFGLIVAVVAVVGTAFFDWEFGSTDQFLPLAIGVLAAIVAIVVVLQNW